MIQMYFKVLRFYLLFCSWFVRLVCVDLISLPSIFRRFLFFLSVCVCFIENQIHILRHRRESTHTHTDTLKCSLVWLCILIFSFIFIIRPSVKKVLYTREIHIYIMFQNCICKLQNTQTCTILPVLLQYSALNTNSTLKHTQTYLCFTSAELFTDHSLRSH